MKIGIVVLATNAYFVLGVRFIKRFMQFYTGEKEIKFFFFSDIDVRDYLPENRTYEVEYIHTTNNNWVDGTNLKFTSILKLEDRDIDYLAYFDADTSVDKDFTEEWFLGEMVGGQHYDDQGRMLENKPFDRNPRSKAYVPKDTPHPEMYFYGAFFGGNRVNMISFCKLMREYQLADKLWGYEPGVNDESYINREFHFNPPEKIVLSKNFKFLISHKGGISDPRYMNADVSHIKAVLLAHKNDNIDIQSNIVIVE